LKFGNNFLDINKVTRFPTRNLVVVMKDEIGSLWKEAIMVVFTASCYYFSGGNEEKDENSQPE
jgi:hypothetical protein